MGGACSAAPAAAPGDEQQERRQSTRTDLHLIRIAGADSMKSRKGSVSAPGSLKSRKGSMLLANPRESPRTSVTLKSNGTPRAPSPTSASRGRQASVVLDDTEHRLFASAHAKEAKSANRSQSVSDADDDLAMVTSEVEALDDFLTRYSEGLFPADSPPAMPRDFNKRFLAAPMPRMEQARVAKLRRYQIVDSTEGNEPFDRIVQFTAALFEFPICLVSLVEDERQWFKARCGLGATETGRDVSFCAHAILRKGDGPFVVYDTHEDWRFRDNPLVTGAPHIRFYAGAPLRTADGYKIGTLCCIDKRPRGFSPEQKARLTDLADMVVRAIESYASDRALSLASRFSEAVSRFALQGMHLPSEDAVCDLAARVAHDLLRLDSRSGVTLIAAARPGGEDWVVRTVLKGREARLRAAEAAPDRPALDRSFGSACERLAAAAAEGRAGIAVDVMEPEDPPMPPCVAEAGACSGVLAAVRGGPDGDAVVGCVGCFVTRTHESLPEETLSFLRLLAAALVGVVEQQRGRAALERREAALAWRTRLSDGLLRSILPGSLIGPLMSRQGPIARHIPSATILFCDIVGFTRMSSAMPAPHLVEMLNMLFGVFDRLCAHYGVEKIKTIGDAFMAASGVPEARPDHAAAALELALAMAAALARFNQMHPEAPALQLRTGLHSGSLVGGVIGDSKLQYDLWGDTVNVASRMESHGVPGRINASAATRALAGDGFEWESRGEPIKVKGKEEPIECFLLVGRAAGAGRPAPDVAALFEQATMRKGAILDMCASAAPEQASPARPAFSPRSAPEPAVLA